MIFTVPLLQVPPKYQQMLRFAAAMLAGRGTWA